MFQGGYMKKIVYVIFVLFITVLNGIAMEKIKPNIELKYSPAVGEVKESDMGDAMIEVKTGDVYTAFVVLEDYQPPLSSPGEQAFAPIKKDSIWLVIGKLESGEYIADNREYPFYPKAGSKEMPYPYRMVANQSGDAVGLIKAFKNDPPRIWEPKPTNIVKRIDSYFKEGGFKQQFVYSGKSRKEIKISYREFKDDFARPAFTQDLTYDLSESKTIGFKGMKIDVIQATNSQIKFIIKSPMK
jgi:hypothetical protein